jgi:hypothetical protein
MLRCREAPLCAKSCREQVQQKKLLHHVVGGHE